VAISKEPRKPGLLLLFATGALLGLSTNLANLVAAEGVPASAFLILSGGGAALILGAFGLARGRLARLDARTVEYYAIAGLVSFAAPNLILFSAVPHFGAGFAALTIAFPPLITYLGALLLKVEEVQATRKTGVALALAGALLLASAKFESPDAATGWIVATLFAPVLLAIGNLYRSLRWPAGARPDALAPGMLAASTILTLVFADLAGLPVVPVGTTGAGLGWITLQMVTFAVQYLMYFNLQRRGGPVVLSLLGSVAAVVGVPVAVVALGEPIPGSLILAAILTAAGIALVTRTKRDA